MPKVRKNKMKLSRKNLIKLALVLTAILVLIIIVCNLLFSRKTSTYAGLNLNKKMDMNKITLVESKDGIKVPVPKGYTASSVESEMYVNGKYTEKKISKQEELTFTSEGENAWTQRDGGVWQSGGYNVANAVSTLTSNEFQIDKKGFLRINWSVSSEAGYDILYVTLNNIQTGTNENCPNLSGTYFGTSYNNLVYTNFEKELDSGTYTITITYSKNNSSNSGLDRGYVKKAEVYVYDENAEESIERKEYGGFVIYEGEEVVTDENVLEAQKTRNQWVWVPIEDINSMYYLNSDGNIYSKYYTFTTTSYSSNTTNKLEPMLGTYDYENSYLTSTLQGRDRYGFLKEMQANYIGMLESTNTYGGYYISRYEIGDLNSNQPKTVKYSTDIGEESWYSMYKKCKRIDSTNENVTTHMIWGTQQDNTLKWLIDTGEKTYSEVGADSTSWGNYRNATFEYTTASGGISTKSLNSQTRIPAGSAEYTKANNIYDLAGNVWDWTMEAYGSSNNYRRCRGGSYNRNGSSYPAYYRFNVSPNNEDYVSVGFRAALYIQ